MWFGPMARICVDCGVDTVLCRWRHSGDKPTHQGNSTGLGHSFKALCILRYVHTYTHTDPHSLLSKGDNTDTYNTHLTHTHTHAEHHMHFTPPHSPINYTMISEDTALCCDSGLTKNLPPISFFKLFGIIFSLLVSYKNRGKMTLFTSGPCDLHWHTSCGKTLYKVPNTQINS